MWEIFWRLNRQDWLSIGFRRKSDFGRSFSGCDSVIEMEQAGRIAGKHEALRLGQATPEMNITSPREDTEEGTLARIMAMIGV